jgi:hypothetical protein
MTNFWPMDDDNKRRNQPNPSRSINPVLDWVLESVTLSLLAAATAFIPRPPTEITKSDQNESASLRVAIVVDHDQFIPEQSSTRKIIGVPTTTAIPPQQIASNLLRIPISSKINAFASKVKNHAITRRTPLFVAMATYLPASRGNTTSPVANKKTSSGPPRQVTFP